MSFSIDGNRYIVKPGDTLYSISRRTGIPVSSLIEMNGGSTTIYEGQQFDIPDLNPNPNLKEIPLIKDEPSEPVAQSTNGQPNKNIKMTPADGSYRFYVVKNGDNFEKIAIRFGVEYKYLMAVNGRAKGQDGLKIGEKLKIPPTRTAQNIRNLNDVTNALGVSKAFISKLKQLEDGKNAQTGQTYKDTEFHNTPYTDKSGNKTIGIGHKWLTGDKEYLTNDEVLNIFANDLLKKEENLWALFGKVTYENFPQGIKEAILDMSFNKGTTILEEETPENGKVSIATDLLNGDFESAIRKMTNNKTQGGTALSGLSKRRLFDISRACTMYKNSEDIPDSVKNAIQKVYNDGIDLLKAECEKSKANFGNVVTGFNEDVSSFFENMYEITLRTE